LTNTDIDNFTPKKEKDRKAKALKEKNKGITLDSFFEDDTSEDSTNK